MIRGHASLSDGEVYLGYGQRADGTLAHISEVPRGLACGCVCAACGKPLVARKPDTVQRTRNRKPIAHHFAHKANTQCHWAAETTLHKLAKEVIAARRGIAIPYGIASVNGEDRVAFYGRWIDVEDVRVEQYDGTLKPDLILTVKGKDLLVEIYVHHKCSNEKIQTLRATKRSTIEIDCSRYDMSLPRAELEAIILKDAPRYWLYNPKIEAEEESIRDDQAERAVRAAGKRRAQLQKLADVAIKSAAYQQGLAKQPLSKGAEAQNLLVSREGLEDLLATPIEGDAFFNLPRDHWQRFILAQIALTVGEYKATWSRGSIPWLSLDDIVRALAKIPAFAPRLIQGDIEANEREIATLLPGFRTPRKVIRDYLHTLVKRGVLHRNDVDYWHVVLPSRLPRSEAWRRTRQWQERCDRIGALVAKAMAIDDTKLLDTVDFHLATWFRQRNPVIRKSPREAVDADDAAAVETLCAALKALADGLYRGSPVPDDLCGLPVAAKADQVRSERQAAAELRKREEAERQRVKEAAQAQAKIDRVSSIRRIAAIEIGAVQSEAWLIAPLEDIGGHTPLQGSEDSEEQYNRAVAVARAIGERRRREKAKADYITDLQTRLKEQYRRILGRDDVADLMMRGQHPALDNKRPIEICCDEAGFERCLSLVNAKPRRR